MYNYGSDDLGAWVFPGNGSGIQREQNLWRTGAGKWNSRNSQFFAGEFDGKIGTDVLALYDYGTANLGSWLFPGGASGIQREQLKWSTGSGQWELRRGTYLAGRFNDDNLTDITAFYDYGSAELGSWTFLGNGNGVSRESFRWRTGPGQWNAANSKWYSLGLNASNRTDVVAFYNYGNDNLGAWRFAGENGGIARENRLWSTGSGQWNWVGM